MDQIELNDTEWKPLNTAGQSIIAFLDEDNDNETGGIDDVRIVGGLKNIQKYGIVKSRVLIR